MLKVRRKSTAFDPSRDNPRRAGVFVVSVKGVLLASALALTAAAGSPARVDDDAADSRALPHTVDVGTTGFANKRPVLAAACLKGCPWGEIGEYVRHSLAPIGYDVVLCENCNRLLGPGLVADAAYPPPLTEDEMSLGTVTRVNAKVDFGITTTGVLHLAVKGVGPYAGKPRTNLRLLTRIEDPYYVLVAVKANSGITDLAQIRERKLPVRILTAGAVDQKILEFYGLSEARIVSYGGTVKTMIGAPADTPFDVLISELGASTYNPESWFWAMASQKFDLRYFDLPEPLIASLTADGEMERVTARCCLLRGMTKSLNTVGASGEAVFGRDDMPDAVAYDIAKALDRNHAALKWFVRPYSYDPDTAWKDPLVPLHPGAAKYFQERGYMVANDSPRK